MQGQWTGGKGDAKRKAQVAKEEADLRWELAFSKDQARKDKILEMLAKLKGSKE